MSQDWERIKAVKREQGGPPGLGPRRLEKPHDTRKALRRLFSYLSGFRLQLILAVVLILTSSFAGIAGTWFLKPLINGLTAGSPAGALALGRARQVVKPGWAAARKSDAGSTPAERKPGKA